MLGNFFLMCSARSEFFFDPRDVEKNSAVRTSPALFDFAHNATRNVVAR
jgi:hypothetical protein